MLFTHRSNSDTETRPVSVVLSSQVTNVASNLPAGDVATLVFQYSIVSSITYRSKLITFWYTQDNLTNPSNPRCAFWNFSLAQDGYVCSQLL